MEAFNYINLRQDGLSSDWRDNYMWKMIDTKAPKIGSLSSNAHSSETLFRAPSQFEVISIEDKTGKYKLITLKLLEILDPVPSFQLEYEPNG